MSNIVDQICKEQMKRKIEAFDIGDTVEVHAKIIEGGKERIQRFTGIVTGRRGGGIHETFTVRRYVQSEGVERTFPIHSPLIDHIEIKSHGKVRRAKLYYLRDKLGKARRLAERRGGHIREEAFDELPPDAIPGAVPGAAPAEKTEAAPAEKPEAAKKE
jgi:large subunit ribosomal protein L19